MQDVYSLVYIVTSQDIIDVVGTGVDGNKDNHHYKDYLIYFYIGSKMSRDNNNYVFDGENKDLSMKTYSFKSYNYSQDYSMLWDLLCENIYTIIYEEYIHRLGIYQINKYDTFDSKYIVKHYTKEEFIKQCQEDELSYIIPNEVSK